MNPSPAANTAPHESPNPKPKDDPGCTCIGCTIERVARRLGIAVLDIRPADKAPQGSKTVSVDKLARLEWERSRKESNEDELDRPGWSALTPPQRHRESRQVMHLLAQLQLLGALARDVVIDDEYAGLWIDPQRQD